MKSYNDSLKDLLSSAPTWDRVERIALSASLGRVVCHDIAAKSDYPEFETSAMDGYAVKLAI